MEKNRIIFCIFLSVIIFTACSEKDSFFNTLDGNTLFNKGDFAGATVSYMKALGNGINPQWIHYDLGNAYNALGEIEPAIKQYVKALEEKNGELLYRTNFNLGVLYYELGDFENAVRYFKESLKAKPGDLDIKTNLEIAIKNYQSKIDAAQTEKSALSTQNWTEVLDQIQKEEEETWKQISKKQTVIAAEDW